MRRKEEEKKGLREILKRDLLGHNKASRLSLEEDKKGARSFSSISSDAQNFQHSEHT